MKLIQLIENFVISNTEFEDFLGRATEQLVSEIQSGNNARDAIHGIALQFSGMHNKSYDAYTRMSDSLFARYHNLELDNSGSSDMMGGMDDMGPDMMGGMDDMGPDMSDDEFGGDDAMGPELDGDDLGGEEGDIDGMGMSMPPEDDMPSDSDMNDYAAVMDNKPEDEFTESYRVYSGGERITETADLSEAKEFARKAKNEGFDVKVTKVKKKKKVDEVFPAILAPLAGVAARAIGGAAVRAGGAAIARGAAAAGGAALRGAGAAGSAAMRGAGSAASKVAKVATSPAARVGASLVGNAASSAVQAIPSAASTVKKGMDSYSNPRFQR